jgi:hypothetical protein
MNRPYDVFYATENRYILDLWKGIESGNTPGWESGKALEYLILRVFQLGASRFYKLPSDWKSGAAQTKPASAGWH